MLGLTRTQGVVSVRYLKDGRVVMQKWPRRRGVPKSQVTRDQVAVWDLALELTRRAIPEEFNQAYEWSGGTAFYPRDILLSAAYGNYVGWPGRGWREPAA